MSRSMLQGLRVLEFSHANTFTCGRYLASLGAEVILLEPPGGHCLRHSPAPPSLVNDCDDAYWNAQNLGKKSICLDLDKAEDLVACKKLAQQSDFIIEGFKPGYLDSLNLGYKDLKKNNPRIIYLSITPFGQSGPYSHYSGGDIVASAMGGTLDTCGYSDDTPVLEALDACTYHANSVAAMGAMLAHRERGVSGIGQHVDCSIQEVAASRNTNNLIAYQFDQRKLIRAGNCVRFGVATVRVIWQLKDGYCFHSMMTGKFGAPANKALSQWMSEDGVDNPMQDVDWLQYDRSSLAADIRAIWEQAMAAFFLTKTKEDIRTEGARRGIRATVANSPDDVLNDPHLLERDFFTPLEKANRVIKYPAYFVKSSTTATTISPLHSKAGEHNDQLLNAIDKVAQIRDKSDKSCSHALEGVKVLDFGWALVGSLCSKLLADFGADVIKVESALRPCLSRIDKQVSVSKRGELNDKPWFSHFNSSKLSLQINIKHPRVREILDPLIDWANVIVENFSPGTMEGLGLDYRSIKKRRPDIIMVSGSVFGQSGPYAKNWGVDGTGAALAGRMAMTGWPERDPVTPSVPYGDVVLPFFMVATVSAALEYKKQSGIGQHIDASMYEVCAQQLSESIVNTQTTNSTQERMGNQSASKLFQGVFPSKAEQGENKWIAISIDDEAQWHTLQSLVPELSNSTSELRSMDKKQISGIEKNIAKWTIQFNRYELMDRLQTQGIAAGAVQDIADTFERDPQLQQRNYLAVLKHPILGEFGHQSPPLTLSRTPAKVKLAPAMGEHVETICKEILQLDDQVYQSLQADDVFK